MRTVPPRVYAYLIPLPALAMVVRILINSETAILFTVAASVLSAAAASGRWPAMLFLLLCGTAGASRSRRVHDRYRMLWVGVQTAPVCAVAAAALAPPSSAPLPAPPCRARPRACVTAAGAAGSGPPPPAPT